MCGSADVEIIVDQRVAHVVSPKFCDTETLVCCRKSWIFSITITELR